MSIDLKKEKLQHSFIALYSRAENAIHDCYTQECPFKRGAEITATKKHIRRELFTIYLQAYEDEIDTTYTVVKKLSERALGKKLCRKYVLDTFTKKGRTASDKSIDNERVEEIFQTYFIKNDFIKNLEILEETMNDIIKEYKAKK